MRSRRLKAQRFWATVLSLAMVTSGWTPASIAYAADGDGEEEVITQPAEPLEGEENIGEPTPTEEGVDGQVAPEGEGEQVADPEVVDDGEDDLLTAQSDDSVAQIGETGYATLKEAIAAAQSGDTITLLQDADATDGSYYSNNRIALPKSVTIDGANHTITVANRGFGVGVDATEKIDVTFRNLTIVNRSADARCIDTRGNLNSLTLDNVVLSTDGGSGYTQPLTIGGNQAEPATINVVNSTIETNDNGTAYYAIIMFNPVDMTITSSTIKGWANFYFKSANSSAGSAGSSVTVTDSTLISTNVYNGNSNAFGLMAFEDNNITVGVNNSKLVVSGQGNQIQSIASLNNQQKGNLITLGEGNEVTLTGETALAINDDGESLTIKGGTFSEDPSDYIAEGYEVVKNDSGLYVVQEKATYVAQIGETKYETLEAAVAAANEGDTVEILVAGTYTLPNLPKNITVQGDVDGVVFEHTAAGNVASVSKGATFKNVTFNLGNVNYHGFQHAGKIAMEGCTINGRLTSYGDMSFTGCTFNAPGTEASGVAGTDYAMWAYSGNVSYDGCTFNGAGKFVNVYNEGKTLWEIAATDCTFNSTKPNKAAFNVKESVGESKKEPALLYHVTLTNCTTNENFPAASDNGTLTVISGLVQVDDRVAGGTENGGEIVVNVDGTEVYRTPAKKQPVAQIGETKYETLEAAFAAAKDGNTITVLADCEGNGIVVPQGKFTTGLTVDFGSHTYTVSGVPVGSTGTETIGFQLLKDNNIIFKNGTIAGSSRTNENLLRLVQNYSNLTLDGMTLNLEGQYYDQTTMSSCNGTTVVTNSTVNAPDFSWAGYQESSEVGGVALSVGTFSSYTAASVDVQGTSNINGDVNVDPTNEGATALTLSSDAITVTGDIKMLDNAATAATVTKVNTFDKDAPDGYKWVDNGNGTSTLKVVEYVAQIGDTKYETLAEAVASAQSGNTIELLADASGAGIFVGQNDGKNITIDLGGHTYTVDGPAVGSAGTQNQAFHLESNNTVAIKNGTITSTADSGVLMLVQNYSNLTLQNVTLDGSNLPGTGQYVLSTNNASTTIDGSTITAKDGDIAFDACTGWGSYTSNSVTVTGESTITGDIEVSFYGVGTAPTLSLMGGTHDGAILMARGADEATVTKANAYVQDAPEGYEWVDNGDDTSTLKKKCTDHVDVDPADGICDKCGERIGSYVSVTSSGNGSVNGDSVATVSGGGVYKADESVTVTTQQVNGYTFKGWFLSGTTDAVSTSLSYTFTADGQNDYNLVAVYEAATTASGFDLEVVGSKFTVTGFSATQRSRLNTKIDANSSITVKFTGSEHFLYWINSSNKVVSKSATYTFTMVQDTKLTAVYSDADTTNEAMVLFLSSDNNGQLMSSYYCNATDPIDFPHAPSNLGKVFKFWSIDGLSEATADSIHAAIENAAGGRVEVYPVYESSGNYGVTVKFVDEAGNEIKEADSSTYANIEIGSGKDIVAPDEIDGLKFAYWQAEDGTTLAYTASYYVRPTKDVVLTAVYANDVAAQPTIVMTDAFSSMNGSKYRISFTATRSVPEGYTIESVGILYARAENLDTSSDEAIKKDLVLDSENGNVKNLKGTSTTLNGSTTGNINTTVSNRVFYARGYLVVKGSSGVQYIYSDTFLYGSFDSLGQ